MRSAAKRRRSWGIVRALAVAVGLLLLMVLPCVSQSVSEAIVKVYAVSNEPDYYNPWQMQGPQAATGSGCIIDGNRILTSAHVVADEIFLQVKRAGQARRYTAKVEIIAHDTDLAILAVQDPAFFQGSEPLLVGELPQLRDRVVVYGFPQGGEELAITEGVVSRVEHQYYTHSQEYLLACQIDAAINPGNSGGPVIKDGTIVGVAFQAGRGENVGYMVPAPLIRRFLQDVEDGAYNGIPGIGISWQAMENVDLRSRYGMSEGSTGILVDSVFPNSPALGILQEEDVILAIDGKDLEGDGTIEFRPGERTSFSHRVQSKFVGDAIEFLILRDGATSLASVPLTKTLNEMRLVPNAQYDILPRYYIVGGLVFEPLTLNLLKIWGSSWYTDAPDHLLGYYFRGEPTEERTEVVVLVRILGDEVNVGYQGFLYEVLVEANGIRTRDLSSLVQAIEDNTGPFHVLLTEAGKKIVLDRVKVEESEERIIQNYRIPSP
jgi:S1-C subfamily serine protease